MKKNFYFLRKIGLSVILLSGFISLNAQTHITDAAGLQAMSSNPTGDYVLDNDIDLEGITWTPFEFKGTFDGNGFKILNLDFTASDGENYGLFSVLSGGATVTNLGLVDCYVEGPQNVGGLAGKTIEATISRCFVVSGDLGSEVHSSGKTGSFIGFMYNSTISECYAVDVVVTGHDHVGGLVGHAEGSTITDSYYIGDVYTDAWQVGGIVGWAQNANSVITRCYAKGTVIAESGFTGGIIGIADGSEKVVNITDCIAAQTKLETKNPDIWKTHRIIAAENAATFSNNFAIEDIEIIDPHKDDDANEFIDDADGKEGRSIPANWFGNATFYADSLPNWDFTNVWELTENGPVLRMGVSTSIRKNKPESSAKVFSNGGIINIIGAEQGAKIRIYNITGAKVLETSVNSSHEQFSNKGMLIIEIESDKTRSTYKINNM